MTEMSEFPVKFIPHRTHQDGSPDFRKSEDDLAYEWAYSSRPNGRVRVEKTVFYQMTSKDDLKHFLMRMSNANYL